MRHFVWFAICCYAAVLSGCIRTEGRIDTGTAVADTAVGASTEMAPPTISLADVAGEWNMSTTPETGADTTSTHYVLRATADTTGWTMTYPNRRPVPVRVTISGDSIITRAGPYESGRRKGVQVTSVGVLRLRAGRLVGTRIGRYATRGRDTVIRVRVEGTRAP